MPTKSPDPHSENSVRSKALAGDTDANQSQTPTAANAIFAPFLDIVPDVDGDALFISAGAAEIEETVDVVANVSIGGGNKKGHTMTYSDTVQAYVTTATAGFPLPQVVAHDPNSDLLAPATLVSGSGVFTDSGQSLGNSRSQGVPLGDLDGDGDLDAFVANDSGQANRVWLNDRDGDFSDSGQSLGSGETLGVAVKDMDGDGDLDAFLGIFGPNQVWLNENQPALDNFIQVVDQADQPVPGAEVYRNGRAIGVTDQAGLLNTGLFNAGDSLAALALQSEAFTVRAEHDGWAYRTYLTSQPYTVVAETGEQRLVVRRDRPLILFNLVVSIEWQADQAYLDDITAAMKSASDYLYDLTDGQMAFGRVAVFNNGEMWSEADIQIMSKNTVFPHAYIGGLISADKSHVIRLGRFWDGRSGAQGRWSEPAGYRTIAHEFGHYGLHLYDEYIRFEFDENNRVVNQWPAVCPDHYEDMKPEQDAINASAMYYHYLSSELSARGAPGMWSERCEQTAQWQLTERETGRGESAWETLTRMYADLGPAPRWRLTTPLERVGVLAGPDHLRLDFPNWPEITRPASGPPPRRLTVKGPDGRGFRGAIVALYKQTGRVIGQGFTGAQGQLDVFGVEAGDTLRAASMDGDLAGALIAGSQENPVLLLEPAGGLAVQPPYLQIRAEPGLDPDRINLLIALYNVGPDADPSMIVTEPGDETGFAPLLTYSPTGGAWVGQINLRTAKLGLGRIRAAGAVGNDLVRLQTTYRLQRATNDRLQTVYSNDGHLHLRTESGSLPGSESYLVVMSPGAIPAPLPDGSVLVGDLYDVTASGAVVQLEAPAILTLHYDSALTSSTAPESLGLYRWDAYNRRWRKIDSNWDEAQQALVARITLLGVYALLTPQAVALEQDFFLPVIMKMSDWRK